MQPARTLAPTASPDMVRERKLVSTAATARRRFVSDEDGRGGGCTVTQTGWERTSRAVRHSLLGFLDTAWRSRSARTCASTVSPISVAPISSGSSTGLCERTPPAPSAGLSGSALLRASALYGVRGTLAAVLDVLSDVDSPGGLAPAASPDAVRERELVSVSAVRRVLVLPRRGDAGRG
ncbi:hypothetical protein CERSUDRAFT_97937, partial [Gelatoporia subvermispora B]